MKKIYRHRIKCLQETVKKALEEQNKYISDSNYEDKKSYLENLKANLENLQKSINRFIEIMDGKDKPHIGVFGCPSRGKSTLLNVLLGVEILPVGTKAGTTKYGTKLDYSDTEGFTVAVSKKNAIDIPVEPFKNYEDVNNRLRFLSNSENKQNDPDINEITVEGPFMSFIGNDIVFVDTPGVELGASKEDLSKDGIIVEESFIGDRERAMAILSKVDIVIYCMTVSYPERMDKELYKEIIKDKFEPINVITGCDEREDNETNEYFIKDFTEAYELVKDQTVVVSSSKALEIIKKAKEEKKDLVKLDFEKEALKNARKDRNVRKSKNKLKIISENLKGFNELREKLRARIGDKSPAFCNMMIFRFERRYEYIKKDADKKEIWIPDIKGPSKIRKFFKGFFIGLGILLIVMIVLIMCFGIT